MSGLTGWERGAWAVAALLALLIPLVPWLERTFDPRLAVVLAALHNAGEGELDPWGRPWARSPAGTYSLGPDGVDDGGRGDDLVLADIFTLEDHAWIPSAVLFSPRRALAVAALALALWTFATRGLIRAPRDGRVGIEVLRAAGMTAVPACLGWLWLLGGAEAPPRGIARLGVAVPFAWTALCLLAGLGWRLSHAGAVTRGRADGPGAPDV